MKDSDSRNSFFFLKELLDKFLILDLFLVMLGSLFFVSSIFLNYQGLSQPLKFFQSLWIPLFVPAITLLITAILINGLISWLRDKELDLN